MKSKYYGIDLGTSKTGVAQVQEDGKPRLVSPYFPSIVNLKTREVGDTVVKKPVTPYVRSSTKINMTTDKVGTEAVASAILILSECKKYMADSSKAVITVPAYFDYSQREATLIAAKKAGIEVLKIINEPTAASLNINYSGVFAVVDLGGGTFDVSLVNKSDNFADVCDSDGYILGGDNLNKRIVSDIYSKCKLPVSLKKTETNMQIERLAESVKISIQKNKKGVNVDLSAAIPELKDHINHSKYTLDSLTYSKFVDEVFGCTINSTKDLIFRNGFDLEDIELVLVGGSTLDPFYIELIEKNIKKPLNSLGDFNNEEVVAKGASLYAKAIEYGTAESTLSDLCQGISIETGSGIEPLIRNGTKAPVEIRKLFTNATKSDSILVKLLSSSDDRSFRQLVDIDYELGRTVDARQGLILLILRVNSDGTLNIVIKDGMNEQKSISIVSEKISSL